MQTERQYIDREEALDAIKAYAEERANVPNVHPHRFRHTMATNLIDRGMKIQEVSTILGHAKLDTTMTYVHVNQRNTENDYRRYASL